MLWIAVASFFVIKTKKDIGLRLRSGYTIRPTLVATCLSSGPAAKKNLAYFLAKLLVMVEKKSIVRFNDYIGTFFAAYVLLIGIWYLQPRINRAF